MKATSTLAWWIKFAQMDLDTYYNKTLLKIHAELVEVINPHGLMCPWDASTFRISDLEDFQKGALKVVEAMKDPSRQRPVGEIRSVIRMQGMTGAEHIRTSINHEETATGLMLRAYRDANIEARQLTLCKYCKNLMLQQSLKRKKKFCSSRCLNRERLDNAKETE